MSIFPFISPEVLESSESSELPIFREYAYDFENNTGEPPIVAVWVDGSGKIFCHASETISGVAGQIEFIADR